MVAKMGLRHFAELAGSHQPQKWTVYVYDTDSVYDSVYHSDCDSDYDSVYDFVYDSVYDIN